MDTVLGDVLPLAFGVALSPIPVAAVIIMLMTPAARVNAPLFLVSWMAGLTVIGVAVFLLPGLETRRGDPTMVAGILRGALGLLLLGMAIRQWRARPEAGKPVPTPPWMARVHGFGPAQAAGLGVLLTAVHPKNLPLTIAAAAMIDESRLLPGQQAVGLLVFVVLASTSVGIPVMIFLLFGRAADQPLARAKEWLVAHNAVVTALLLLVFGTLLVTGAIRILSG